MTVILGTLFALVAACCLAGQALTIRLAADEGEILHLLFIVTLMNTVVFIPLSLSLDPDPIPNLTALSMFLIAGFVSTVLGRASFFAGIRRIGASRAEAVKGTMPLFATVTAVFLIGEAVTNLQIVGILLIIAGVVMVSWEGTVATRVIGEKIKWDGLALPLIGAFLYGLEPAIATIGFREGTSVFAGLAIKTGTAALCFFGYIVWKDSLSEVRSFGSGLNRWYLFTGLINTTFLLSYYGGLNVSRVGIVVPIMQISPLLAALASALFLREKETVTLHLVAAAGVIVIGAVIVTAVG